MLEKQQVMPPTRAARGTLSGKKGLTSWPLSRLWRVSNPALFRITLAVSLLATALGGCGPPPPLNYASPVSDTNQTDFKVGTILKYTCRPGYSRSSSSLSVICDLKGEWKTNIVCVKKRCRNPGDLPNGLVKVKTDFSFGSQIEFSCSEGYILIGSTTSVCEIQEKTVEWSDPFPVCEIATCEPPPDIVNGRHSGTDEDHYTYGASVTYSCDRSYSLLGSDSISCTVENETMGVWRPSPPTCERIVCQPPNVEHGKIVSGFGSIYTYKDSIVYSCQAGFILRGSSLIRCQADGSWSPSPPICERNSCPELPDIPHAFWSFYFLPTRDNLYVPGTKISYSCHPGYKPATNEPTNVVCQKDFTWSPFKGCKKICCPKLDMNNGEILPARNDPTDECLYSFGDKIRYTCSDGITRSTTCRSDGKWSVGTPLCPENCNVPPSIAHGRHTQVSSRGFLSDTYEVRYECDNGYTLDGEERLTCSNSRWSPKAPQCKALCPKPEIDNGKLSVDKAQYVESENVTIHCDSGFGIVGSQSITCLENRTWFPEMPKCKWETREGCEPVELGKKLMQCLPDPADVKMALEVYKLSLEIELLKLQTDKLRQSTLDF